MKANKITNASELRAVLLGAMEAVIEGSMNVSQANALVGISSEVHKSIRQEWDMRVYAAENIAVQKAQVLKVLE